jgi:hypothetical protein
MIALLFTRNGKIGSRVIRWVADEDVSHVAIRIADTVFEARFSGVALSTFSEFITHHDIVHTVYIDCDLDTARNRLLRHMATKRGYYDYPAFIMLGLLLIWKRLTKSSAPIARNPWQKPWMDMCTELATYMLGMPTNGTLTPGQLYQVVIEDPHNYEQNLF